MKISIITINFNNVIGLKKTIESVVNQTGNNFEYIIIDGGSSDGSKEIIEKYSSKLAYWVSEKDDGIYNAMNKGVLQAKGEYLLFLNSGDYLFDYQVLTRVEYKLQEADHVCGRMFWVQENQKLEEYKYQHSRPTFEYFFSATLPHQAAFSRKEIFTKYGLYDENMKICSDWKMLIISIFKHGCTVKYIDEVISIRASGGISTQKENFEIMRRERENVLKTEFSIFFDAYSDLKRFRYLKSSRIMRILKMFGFFKYLPI